jgi:hypothetical protein
MASLSLFGFAAAFFFEARRIAAKVAKQSYPGPLGRALLPHRILMWLK